MNSFKKSWNRNNKKLEKQITNHISQRKVAKPLDIPSSRVPSDSTALKTDDSVLKSLHGLRNTSRNHRQWAQFTVPWTNAGCCILHPLQQHDFVAEESGWLTDPPAVQSFQQLSFSLVLVYNRLVICGKGSDRTPLLRCMVGNDVQDPHAATNGWDLLKQNRKCGRAVIPWKTKLCKTKPKNRQKKNNGAEKATARIWQRLRKTRELKYRAL